MSARLKLMVMAAGFAYLVWRVVTVASEPTAASVVFVVTEFVAWLGFVAFLVRVTPPLSRATTPVATETNTPPRVVVVVGSGSPLPPIERSLLALDASRRTALVVVDDGQRDVADAAALAEITKAAGGSVVIASGSPVAAALAWVDGELDDAAIVVLDAGSLLSADALDALVAPLTDASVGAVQGRLAWSDGSVLTMHRPSEHCLALFNQCEAPVAGAAGIASLLHDGIALRLRALRDVDTTAGDLGVALAAQGWSVRFATRAVIHRRRPSSSAEWRVDRTAQVLARRRRANAALTLPGLRFGTRLRMIADVGDIASAFARVGLVASVVIALVVGRAPVPGSSSGTVVAAAAIWTLAALATRIAVGHSVRFGDRLRSGWHCVDADVFATFARRTATRGGAARGRLRSLASFPLSVIALIAIDAAAVARGLALVRPGIVSSTATAMDRATIGVAAAATLAFLFDSLRIFVARPDARTDLRVRSGIRASITRMTDGTDATATLVDLSTTGAGIVATTPLARGERVQLRFDLVDPNASIDISAIVARTSESEGSVLGIQFLSLSSDTRRALNRYVATHPPVPTQALPTANAQPSGLKLLVPRPVLRFASVVAVVVMGTSLAVVPAASAAPATEGVVNGTVSDPSGPAAGVCVNAVTDSWAWYGTQTDSAGAYSLPLPVDSYRVQFRDCRSGATDKLVTAWWSSGGVVNQDAAEHFALADGETRAGVDAVMVAGGWFAGVVQDPQGALLDGVCMNPVTVDSGRWDGGTNTPTNGGPTGSFQSDALPAGQYRIHFNDCSGQAEPFAQGWLGLDGRHLVASPDDARMFDLADGPIDVGTVELAPGTRITGTVRDDAGAAAPGVCVGVVTPTWSWLGGATTSADGSYVTDPLLPGEVVLTFNDCQPNPTLINSLWTGTDATINDINAASRVTVDGSSRSIGPFDQALQRGGRVSGTVISDLGPVAGACIGALVPDGSNFRWLAGTQSQPDGSFVVGPVAGDIILSLDDCGNSNTQPIIRGVYAGPGHPLTNDPSSAVSIGVGFGNDVTDIALHPELGVTLSGTVTGNGGPLSDACVSIVEPSTGYPEGRRTGADGRWSVVVPSGSYLVWASDCVPGRGYAARFVNGAVSPSTATPVVVVGGDVPAALDIDLPATRTTSVIGRIVTGRGEAPAACVVLLAPNQEPLAIAVAGADGTFELGPINPGPYVVGIAGCDFSQGTPPGVVDPSDPSVVYPLQWSSGVALDIANLWRNPALVTALADAPLDLGTICLQPCQAPTTASTTTVPTTSAPTTTAPVTNVPSTTAPTTTAPATTRPTASAPDAGNNAVFVGLDAVVSPPLQAEPLPVASSAQTAVQSIAPSAPSIDTVAIQTSVEGDAITRETKIDEATIVAKRDSPASAERSPAWWWAFAVAAVLGLVAATIPWLKSRSTIARS